MSSERIKVEKRIKDCGNGWCGDFGVCRGHTLKYTYNSIVDYSTLELDGKEFIAPDNVIDALSQLVIDANNEAGELK
jgi:hypothetical protein